MQEGKQGRQGGEPDKPLGFEEVLEIAQAMSARQTQEVKFLQPDVPEDLPAGVARFSLPDEVMHNLQTVRTAMLIQRLEDPSIEPDIEEVFEAISADSYEQIAEMVNEQYGHDAIGGEETKELLLNFGKVFDEEKTEGDGLEDGFVRQFEAAKEVAKQHGTTIAEVYRQDNLYVEMFHAAYTPQEFAAQGLKSMQVISEKSLNTVMARAMETLVPEDMREGLSEEEMNEIMAELQLDPMIRMTVKGLAESMQSNLKMSLMNRLVRFWGEEALEALPEDMKIELGLIAGEAEEATIGVDIGSVAIIGADAEQIRLLAKRQEFVEIYFAERGWDIDSPTTEQILEVRSQPGWINPES